MPQYSKSIPLVSSIEIEQHKRDKAAFYESYQNQLDEDMFGRLVSLKDQLQGQSETSGLLSGSKSTFYARMMHFIQTDMAFRHATQVSVAMLLSLGFNFIPLFEDVIGGKSWASVTVITIFETTYGGFLTKGYQRVMGTFIGGFLGLLYLWIVFALSPNCLKCGYKPQFLAVMILLSVFVISFLKIRSKSTYTYLIMALTILIVVLGEYGDPAHSEDWDPEIPFYFRPFYDSALLRIGLVFSGVLITFVVSTFVFPERAATRLPEKLGCTIDLIADLQTMVHNSYIVGLDELGMVKFRDECLVKADEISSELEKIRTAMKHASGELFLNRTEKKILQYMPKIFMGTERLFYLTVTMVYGRLWSGSSGLHTILLRELHVIMDAFDIVLRTMSKIFKRRLLLDPEPYISPNLYPQLHELVDTTIKTFKQQQIRLFYSESSKAFGEKDWTLWNHFSLSFLQCMVNLEYIIEETMEMSAQDGL